MAHLLRGREIFRWLVPGTRNQCAVSNPTAPSGARAPPTKHVQRVPPLRDKLRSAQDTCKHHLELPHQTRNLEPVVFLFSCRQRPPSVRLYRQPESTRPRKRIETLDGLIGLFHLAHSVGKDARHDRHSTASSAAMMRPTAKAQRCASASVSIFPATASETANVQMSTSRPRMRSISSGENGSASRLKPPCATL